jgi:hypothetical protein
LYANLAGIFRKKNTPRTPNTKQNHKIAMT